MITDNDYRYALINVKVQRDTMYNNLIMEDIGWLDIHRLHTGDMVVEPGHGPEPVVGQKRKRDDRGDAVPTAPTEQNPTRCAFFVKTPLHVLTPRSFRLETKVLRELYAYCW